MEIEEVVNEPMFCLFTPDGVWQGMTLAPDFAMCLALVNMLHSKGMGQSYADLLEQGFRIKPVSVTILKR